MRANFNNVKSILFPFCSEDSCYGGKHWAADFFHVLSLQICRGIGYFVQRAKKTNLETYL